MDLRELRGGFRHPAADCRPMVRWWWFGPTVERRELTRQLEAMVAAGIGGVEVAHVYPLAPASCDFLSEEALGHLRHAAEEAHRLGLRFDLTLGSGWSFGGPHVGPDLAARRLHWERHEVGGSAAELELRASWPGDELVAAFVGDGSVLERPSDVRELAVRDGRFELPAGGQPRVVLVAWSRLTGQQVKRAAAGAEGPVLDHYSARAAAVHLEEVGERLLGAVPAGLVGAVFCDSLEVYGADWTPDLLTEFERRRGYDSRPRLHQLVLDGPGCEELRADHLRTLSELYEEHFVAPLGRWAREHGVDFRIQSYGVPPATLSSYRSADVCEGEGWGWRDLTTTRWAASAAHLLGRTVVSAEAWTWLHSPSFRATPLDVQGEAHEHLLQGVNQLVAHGWPYSPADAPGLGWFFYAAAALDDRNPWWSAAPALNAYLQRLCWLMRQGEPVRDVLVYLPTEDVYTRMGRPEDRSLDLWRSTAAWVGRELTGTLREHGLDYDLVDDDALALVDPASAPVVVLPRTSRLPAAARRWLDAVTEAGGTVIGWQSEVEGALLAGTPEELVGLIERVTAPAARVTGEDGRPVDDLAVVARRLPGAHVHLVVNTGPHPRTAVLRSRGEQTSWQEWDASSGEVRRTGSGPVGLSLAPYQATVVVTSADPVDPPLDGGGPEVRRRPVGDGWRVRFEDGPESPVALPHRWQDDPARRAFAGRATYTTSVRVGPDEAAGGDRLWLDLGPCTPLAVDPDAPQASGHSFRAEVATPVGEVAEVWVDDVRAGVLWSPPYRLDLTGLLGPGAHELRLVVAGTAAGALAADAATTELVAGATARDGRRFVMQDLDLAEVGLSSGLLAVPELVVTSG
ncbi:glycosyl hydrolase [Auraticoccus monumenti]|uniref:Alpha-L-rhamnosidase n=1 Tax=Auraticoccus monumenti TaxID=675864 RepID=A0A1G6XVX1_9ACTN|nr:glycosyl hydrolase [Auraticoccus monumenti]SDD82172.1 hypothetical protein SAMN04489747_1823 [Auraticoccus monumenti]